jgi:hypothetical protein
MRHIHFGAGHFGLGFGSWLFWKAGIHTVLVNRSSRDERVDPPDTVSKRRRNELLGRRKYAVSDAALFDKNNGAELIDYVSISDFLEYNENDYNSPILNSHFEYDAPLCITFSLSRLDNYRIPLAFVRQGLAARNAKNVNHPVYIMAFENSISAADTMTRLSTPNEPSSLLDSVIPLEVCVDRVCTMIDENDGILEVETERHARLVIQNAPRTDALKEAFAHIPNIVQFSDYIDIEKNKKRWILNGSHALIAITSQFHGLRELGDFFHEDNLPEPPNQPSRRAPDLRARIEFSKGVIAEMLEGFILCTTKTEAGAEYLVNREDDLGAYAEEIYQRMSNTYDTTSRIVKKFVAPRLEHDRQSNKLSVINTVTDFFNWARPRVEEPIRAYIEQHGSAPKYTVSALINMFVMVSEGDFLEYIENIETK